MNRLRGDRSRQPGGHIPLRGLGTFGGDGQMHMRSDPVAEGGGGPPSAGERMLNSSILGWFASSTLMDRARLLVRRPRTDGSP